MEPNNNTAEIQPPQERPQNRRMSKNNLLAILVVAVLLAAAAAAYLVYKNRDDIKQTSSGQGGINANEVSLAGITDGSGLAFTKPSDLISVGGEDNNTRASYVRLVEASDGTTYVSTARIVALSTKFSQKEPLTAEQLNELKNIIEKDVNSQEFRESFRTTLDMLKLAFQEPTITAKMSNAKPFTNPNIKENAWQFDVSATDSSGLTPEHKGVLLWIGGKNTFYRFIYTESKDSWDGDTSRHQKVLDSIKIDQ